MLAKTPKKPRLIIISGQTSTGKSTLARRLAKDLGLKTFLKDDYKESQFNLLKRMPSVREMSRIERKSWLELYKAVQVAGIAKQDLIIEGNFTKAQRRALVKIIENQEVIEIFCFANPSIVLKRYVNRNKLGERHAGHRDSWWYWIVWIEGICARLGWHWVRPLRLGNRLSKIDTSNFNVIDYFQIIELCKV